MEIRGKKVLLRDPIASDLEDYALWDTVETEWQQWDAPWECDEKEPEGESWWERQVRPLIGREIQAGELRRRFEICLLRGEHIGWVNSYYFGIDKQMLAIGMGIPSVTHRGKGHGRESFSLFIRYLLDNGITGVYTQTWSGNIPMIKMAENIGFYEIERVEGSRTVRGKEYDGLTFKLALKELAP